MSANRKQVETLPLAKAAEYLLDECRMVLPGIQALCGFQLIVVFNDGFSEKLTSAQQFLHLVSIALVVVAVTIIMTPAAYHRHQGGREVTERFLSICTRLLIFSMLPLAIALCLDLYLVMAVIVDGAWAPLIATLFFAFIILFWFIFPRVDTLQRLVLGKRATVG